MKKSGLFCLLLSILLAACRENIDEVTVTDEPYIPPQLEQWDQPVIPVNGSVKGFVSDEHGHPVENAAVKLGTLTITTDQFGHFFFRDIALNEKGTLVQVEKEGYFPGSRRFFAISEVENNITIRLIPKSFIYNFDAGSGGMVEMNGGATINFAPNTIQLEDGTPYSGNVQVAAYWLDPEASGTTDQMPGNLQGVNFQSEEVVLGTVGMMAVELVSEQGDPLNILKGNTATISMPIPPEAIANMPSEVPTWSYNEDHGMWVEEGKAMLEGNAYVGKVEHFSYWNYGFPAESVDFTATFIDSDGEPLENYHVLITQPPPTYIIYAHGRTCDQGIAGGPVPKDTELFLKLIAPCGELIYYETLPPSSEDIDLGTVNVSSGGIKISGELLDCDGNPVQNGAVSVQYDGSTVYEYIGSNPFVVKIFPCGSSPTITVSAFDFNTIAESLPVIYPDVEADTNVGQIEVCDQGIQDYILINANGFEQIFSPATIQDTLSGQTMINYYHQIDPLTSVQINIIIEGVSEGTYDGPSGNRIKIIHPDPFPVGVNNQHFENFEITEYGADGEPILGIFSGTVTNGAVDPPEDINITGMFNIRLQ